MRSGNFSSHLPVWPAGTRVRLDLKGSDKFGQIATIVAGLPNPSGRREHQWYDVQFAPAVYGRFLEKHLKCVPIASEARTA